MAHWKRRVANICRFEHHAFLQEELTSLDNELQACSSPTVQISAADWEKAFHPGPGFIGFKGHFPGNPVLPAIVQLRMLRMAAAEVLGSVELLDITSAKFLAPAGPGTALAVRLHSKEGHWAASITSKGLDGENTVSEFRFKVSCYEQK